MYGWEWTTRKWKFGFAIDQRNDCCLIPLNRKERMESSWQVRETSRGSESIALASRAEFMRGIDVVVAAHENISSDGLCFLITQISEQLPPLKEPSLTTESN